MCWASGCAPGHSSLASRPMNLSVLVETSDHSVLTLSKGSWQTFIVSHAVGQTTAVLRLSPCSQEFSDSITGENRVISHAVIYFLVRRNCEFQHHGGRTHF